MNTLTADSAPLTVGTSPRSVAPSAARRSRSWRRAALVGHPAPLSSHQRRVLRDGERQGGHLADGPHRELLFIPLMAGVLFLLLRGLDGIAVWVSRIALVVFPAIPGY